MLQHHLVSATTPDGPPFLADPGRYGGRACRDTTPLFPKMPLSRFSPAAPLDRTPPVNLPMPPSVLRTVIVGRCPVLWFWTLGSPAEPAGEAAAPLRLDHRRIYVHI